MRTRSTNQEDYLIRLIEQAAEALRRLRARLMSAEAPDVVRQDAAAAISVLLGDTARILAQLDPDSAARLAGSAERVAAWVALLELEAEAAARNGDDVAAQARRARADALRAAAVRTFF